MSRIGKIELGERQAMSRLNIEINIEGNVTRIMGVDLDKLHMGMTNPKLEGITRDVLKLTLAEIVDMLMANGIKSKVCKHENTHPHRDYVNCLDCGYVKTDSNKDWGKNKNKWFEVLPKK